MTTEAEALFSTTNNLQMIIICLIGGVGTLWGPWIGAFILFGIQEALRMLVQQPGVPGLAGRHLRPAGRPGRAVPAARGDAVRGRARTRLTWRVFARNLVAASRMSAPILQVRDAAKRFGGVMAVQDISFDVQPGEIVGLIGPNGAGKTTLVNLITGDRAADQRHDRVSRAARSAACGRTRSGGWASRARSRWCGRSPI